MSDSKERTMSTLTLKELDALESAFNRNCLIEPTEIQGLIALAREALQARAQQPEADDLQGSADPYGY